MIKFKIGKKFLFLANDRNNVISKYDNDLINKHEINKIISSINKLKNKNIFIINIPDKIEIYPEDLNKKKKNHLQIFNVNYLINF